MLREKLTELGDEDLVSFGDSCDSREDDENGQSSSDPVHQLLQYTEHCSDLRGGNEYLRGQLAIVLWRKKTYPDNDRYPDTSMQE